MKIEIYSKSDCFYCVSAKNMLENEGIPYKDYTIGKTINREEVLEKFPNARTVPIILIDDVWVGGYTELKEIISLNKSSMEFITQEEAA